MRVHRPVSSVPPAHVPPMAKYKGINANLTNLPKARSSNRWYKDKEKRKVFFVLCGSLLCILIIAAIFTLPILLTILLNTTTTTNNTASTTETVSTTVITTGSSNITTTTTTTTTTTICPNMTWTLLTGQIITDIGFSYFVEGQFILTNTNQTTSLDTYLATFTSVCGHVVSQSGTF